MMRKNMTYKQIEASRNRRLWMTQVIVPLAGPAIMLATNPAVQDYVKARYAILRLRLNKWKADRQNRKKQPVVKTVKFRPVN